MTDSEIIEKLCLGGKPQLEALEHLYKHKGREFGRFFMSFGLDKAEADDILQETILKILKNAKSFKSDGNANAWLWQIARNARIDHFRKNLEKTTTLNEDQWDEVQKAESSTIKPSTNVTLISDSTAAGNNTSNRLVEECVSVAITKFSEIEPERAYVLDLLVEGIEGKEIAERIGRTYAATRQYLSECRKHLMPFVGECYELLNT